MASRRVLTALCAVIALASGSAATVPGGSAAAGPEAPAAASAGHREVVLQRVGDSFRVQSQTLRGSDPSSQYRQPRNGGQYRVTARDGSGRVEARTFAADSTEVHYDYPARAGGHRLAGGIVAGDGRVVVQLPPSTEAIELRITGNGVDTLVPVAPLTGARADVAAPAPPAVPVVDNGDPATHVDIVFLGDGFTSAEMSTYQSDVQRFSDYLFTQAPFTQWASFFNVHRVDVVSNQSGTDDHCTGQFVDTALDTGFEQTASDCRLLSTNSSDKVYAAAAGAPEADMIVVLVNSNTYGGAATYGGYGVFYRGSDGPEVMAHEIGHSFGLLADEYPYDGPVQYTGPEPTQPNVTTQTSRSGVKWRDWIAPTTAIPSLGPSDDVPGLFEGASYSQFGVYRPTYNSKMRELYRPFERVDSALLADRIFDFVPDPSPPSGSITQSGPVSGGAAPLTLSYTDAGSYVASYQLSNYSDFRDSARRVASRTPTFTSTQSWTLLPGTGARTVWVRVTNGAGLTTTQTVQVQVADSAVPGVPQGFTLAKNDAGASATISWTPPASSGGSAITGYRVARSAAGGKAAWSTTLAGSARSFTFTGLTAGATFTLSVAAANASGLGPPATGTVTMAAKVPAAPVVGTAERGVSGGAITATARWSPPSSTGGSPITGYRVRALRMSSTGAVLSTTTSAVLPASARSLVMTLPQFGNYRFTVGAINAIGAGPRSARSNLVAGR
jgi:IgA Peptidase M64/Fibronectin type III domain